DVRFFLALHHALAVPGGMVAAPLSLAPRNDVAAGVVLAVAIATETRDALGFLRSGGQVVNREVALGAVDMAGLLVHPAQHLQDRFGLDLASGCRHNGQ